MHNVVVNQADNIWQIFCTHNLIKEEINKINYLLKSKTFVIQDIIDSDWNLELSHKSVELIMMLNYC